MKNIVITVGQIPARLDSVKFVTNRFRGGLALKTAEYLKAQGHNVTVVHWKFNKVDTDLHTVPVDDVMHYYKTVLSLKADAYILAAAVANLMPSKPYEGKFPSHNYKVGEKFNIEFTIAPRLIDEIKAHHPRATLIGYKLLDGRVEDLIAAGKKTLIESKANLVFANDPVWAKDKKLAITADGAVFPLSFDEHLEMIDKVVNEEWFQTARHYLTPLVIGNDRWVIDNYPKHKVDGQTFGCFAIRKGDGFFTTTRGKRSGDSAISFVAKVDFEKRVVHATRKATLNAPLLAKIFQDNPHIGYLIHGHDLRGNPLSGEYQFPGSLGDLRNSFVTKDDIFVGRLEHHGYIAGFAKFKDVQAHCNEYLATV